MVSARAHPGMHPPRHAARCAVLRCIRNRGAGEAPWGAPARAQLACFESVPPLFPAVPRAVPWHVCVAKGCVPACATCSKSEPFFRTIEAEATETCTYAVPLGKEVAKRLRRRSWRGWNMGEASAVTLEVQ